jgi:hypothetical protein
MTKTMTGKTPTKVEVNPEVKEDKKWNSYSNY